MKKNKLLLILLALVAFGQTAWAWSGSGTSSDPYLITNAEDWNTLATNVNAGTSYSGKYFKLTADITVSEMVGTDANRFSGIFIGDGHTLTFNKGTFDNRFSDAYCGAFRYINGATIKRLHVAGTIYTSNQFAGMVGHAIGTNYIQSCHCSLTINSSINSNNPDGTHGGFIANNNQTSYLTNCLFDGSFISTNTTNCGGFIGWTGSGHAYFTNCLFAPTNIDFTNASTCKTFARYNNSNADYTKCYYKQTFGTVDGGANASSMSNADLLSALGGMWEISGDKVIPVIHPFSLSLAGSGTANDPYQITSTTDWDAFAAYVNSGIDFSESYFKLTDDITVSEMAGTNSNRFSGTFNGDGHTLTFNKGTSGNRFTEQHCGPFRYIKNATIKRLHVAGTIYTSNQFAGVVGRTDGTNYFNSCHSSLKIDCSKSGDGTNGGFIGVVEGTRTYFTNCLFDGQLLGSSSDSDGGFCGWSQNGVTFTNCLFAPASVTFSTSGSKTFSRGNSVSISNSYYKQTFGDAQGTDGSSMSNEQLLTALGSAWQISGEKVVPVIQKQTLTGSGIEGDPYLIASTADWNKLAYNVTFCDESYSGQYFKLTDNITISATIGSESFPFGGIFDGDGHILNLNISDYSSQGTAPFRYISDATIKDVKTTGVVIGGIHCSGLVGFATGTTNLIQGCEVAASVNCCGNSHTHCGGIVGHASNSNTTVQDCLFSGAIDGATNTTGIILGWGGNDGTFAIGNCLSTGDYSGCSGTILLIANRGTWTCTNSYRKTFGPTDGIDASGMSNTELLTALGSEWGTRGRNVVPAVFATSGEVEGVASVDEESTYTPTQIINGKFATRPWMDYQINGNRITELNESYSDQTIEASFPNGVNGGWNTTENKVYHGGLFEYMETIGGYNPNVPNFGNYVEMNAHHSAVLSQDLSTHEHDVIRWSLLHAVRTSYGPDVQSMRVEVGAPQYDGENIVAAIGIDDAVDSKITDTTKATYASTGYSGSYAQGGDNLTKLALSKTSAEDNSTWHTVRGIYMIPDGQTVTRFAFIATSANTRDGGNLLDNLEFSTLIGNLSAVQLDNGDVLLRGYWGETDASKHLVVATNSKTNTSFDMTSVANENFKITIPRTTIGEATSLSVYHEDYPEAGRTISITPSYSLSITAYTSEANGWHLISSPIGTVRPIDVINMTSNTYSNTYDIFRFNQNPAITTVEEENENLEWENWKRPNEGEGGINHYHFDLEPGRGYLYANSKDVTLIFSGTPYSGDGEFTLEYSEGNPARNMWGWNLVGNPFATTATLNKPFYKMNNDGNGLTAKIEDLTTTIAAMEGVFVQATAEGQSATFTAQTSKGGQQAIAKTNIVLSGNKGKVLDNAIIRFDNGETLGKFYFGEQDANIYIPKGTEEYAIAYSNGQGEMPLNFKANANGEYTITVNPENVEMAYLHLIDNMTGVDIDLLQTPEYTFTAKTTDYESRFRLVFICTDANDDNGSDNDNFAFFSNGQLIVNNSGEATLQVIDITGRILSSETINGSVSKSINQPAGVYMLRLINGNDVKVQKMVVR